MFDLAINNIALLCTATPQGILRQRKVSIGIKDGNICAIERYPLEGEQNIDAQGLIALPGLIDAHTHSIWGGSRAQEFARRLSGVPYTQIDGLRVSGTTNSNTAIICCSCPVHFK